jgi:hypothetical protein
METIQFGALPEHVFQTELPRIDKVWGSDALAANKQYRYWRKWGQKAELEYGLAKEVLGEWRIEFTGSDDFDYVASEVAHLEGGGGPRYQRHRVCADRGTYENMLDLGSEHEDDKIAEEINPPVDEVSDEVQVGWLEARKLKEEMRACTPRRVLCVLRDAHRVLSLRTTGLLDESCRGAWWEGFVDCVARLRAHAAVAMRASPDRIESRLAGRCMFHLVMLLMLEDRYGFPFDEVRKQPEIAWMIRTLDKQRKDTDEYKQHAAEYEKSSRRKEQKTSREYRAKQAEAARTRRAARKQA